jgi:hypothetical protein
MSQRRKSATSTCVGFAAAVRNLRSECLTLFPVRVRRCAVSKELFGDCGFRNKQYYIRVDQNMDEESQVLILIHEWAHAMSWGVKDDNHGPYFGVAYAQAYKAVYG